MPKSGPRYWFPKPYADLVQRLRVAGGFVLLLAFGFFARPEVKTLLQGLPISLYGLLLRAWAAGHLAKDRQLATSGPYAYVRNPLYLGTLLAAFGLVVAANHLGLAILFALVFLLVYLPAVELEEQHLRVLFDQQYETYAEEVNRFLPRRRYVEARGRFSRALYLKNEEYKAAAGWLVAVAWLVWRCWQARVIS